MTDRPPPHSHEAEQAVLGSILLDYIRVMECCIEGGITEDSFYVPAHRTTYAAMLHLHGAESVINLPSLIDSLRTTGQLDAAGGVMAIHALVDNTYTAADAEQHIAIVAAKHKLRRLMDVCQQACVEAAGSEAPDALIAATENQLEQIGMCEPEETPERVWAGILARINAAERGETQEIGLPTGIEHVDRVVDGLRKGGVYFLTGEKGCGKTTIVSNITNHVVAANKKVLFFTLEMTMEQLMERLAGVLMSASVTQLIKGTAAVREESKQIATAALTNGNLTIDAHTDNLDQFAAKVRKFAAQGGDLVILDYIQRLQTGRGGKLFDETTAISQRVTRTAKRHKIPILCVSMESKDGLYGSRSLDYDSFATLAVRRRGEDTGYPDYEQVVDVWVDKNRFGPSHVNLPVKITGRTGAVSCWVD